MSFIARNTRKRKSQSDIEYQHKLQLMSASTLPKINYGFKRHKFNNIDSENDIDIDSEGEQVGMKNSLSNIFGNVCPKSYSEHGRCNHIYFDDAIDKNSCKKLIGQLEDLNIKLGKLTCDYDLVEQPKIYLHINSPGGSVFSALSVIDTMRQSKFPIVTIVEGGTASAATLISCFGSERWITKYGYMLIHQLSSSCWGKMAEIEDEFANLQDIMERIYEIYEEHTKLNRTQLKKILKGDRWWRAETCLKHGLVDKII